MTKLERAWLAAAETFVAIMRTGETAQVPTQSATKEKPPVLEITETSNGLYVCSRHGKAAMDKGRGPFCTSKEDDPRFSNKNGYCNAKAIA